MNHYPSSAELAAFRRAIPKRHPAYERAPGSPFRTRSGGRAWPWERRWGVGFQAATPPPGWHADPWASRAGEARRGAAAMRARAFHDLIFGPGWTSDMIHPQAVQCDGTVAPGQRGYVAAWIEELAHGCPAWGKE